MTIEEQNVRYKCNFYSKLFKKCSYCVRHIESKCLSGIMFPSDIKIVDITKEKNK